MKAPWQGLWSNWLARRTPRVQRHTFTQRNVYILPSKGGWVYAVVVLILLLAAINEQLNLAYALAFLLGGVGLSSMSLTHGNLRGLSLSLGATRSVHAGDTLHVPITLDATSLSRGSYGLLMQQSMPCEVEAGQQATFELPVATFQRGWMDMPRWSIETTYPFGLFRAWGYWRAAPPILVWPAVELQAPDMPGMPDDQGPNMPADQTAEQMQEVREWQRGDALRQVVWKKSATRIASGLTPVVRHEPTDTASSTWIDWAQTQGLNTEARLSRLAAWLIRAEALTHQTNHVYGLRMPSHTVPCSKGPNHLAQCMDALATWSESQG